jgi:peptidase M23-like protein
MPPPRPRLVLLLAVPLLVLLLALLLPRPAAAAHPERWRWPLRGDVVGAFRYAPGRPFAAGARRGVDIAARRGATVRAACGGRVTFAGPLPGRRGRGVNVRCGNLVATHLGLGRVAVRRGARVVAGERLGVVGAAGRLRLGARRRSARFGYVDPLGLLGADPPPSRPGPAPLPLGRAPRSPQGPRIAPRGVGHPARSMPALPAPTSVPAAAAPAAGTAIPPLAWGGLILLAAGLPLGGLAHRRRRRRRAAAVAPATASGR